MMSLDDNDYPEIRDAVRKICAGFPGEYWRNLEDQPVEGSYPTEFVNALTESGYLGVLIPEEYGGAGLPIRAGAVILETIHETGCSAGACHAQMYTMGTVLRHGSDAQKKEYLPKIASGELRLQAFGVTEPTTGSDTTQLKTRAVRDGDEYVINGQKVWTSRALHSDLMLLLARTESADTVKKRSDGLSTFLVDMRKAVGNGMEIKPLAAMVNHATTEVFFDNLRIPASALIGEEGKGFRYILDGMNAERILISSEGVGDAKYFTRRAVEYANERVVFGRPIGQNQGVQFPIAKAYADAEAAAMMARKAAALFDAGLPCGAEANMAKHLCSEAAWQAGEACMATFGGFA
ncbi:MAG: acyl-CoA/acyl-ACP dehydrogenase, partial [Alphaproteobacteria bacterium]|nr:acyl-CoA/acyl-ACP dehydrogenase [Alphaproteobacteria bacterium]